MMKESLNIAIIGGGAAGFFLASQIKRNSPETQIVIFEKASRVLSKVKISGGGRCNLTNSFRDVKDLVHVYPRGHRVLKKLFKTFGPQDAYRWFEEKGVPLVTQEDACVFPKSQDAESVILCLRREAQKNGVVVRTGHTVREIRKQEDGSMLLLFQEEQIPPFRADRVAVTTGGSPTMRGLTYLEKLGHKIEPPVPSLYTFHIADKAVNNLMGIVVEEATAFIPGTRFKSQGALLFTHWGMSGPAILKLSSYGARWIQENDYRFPIQINWIQESNTETVTAELKEIIRQYSQKLVINIRPYGLPVRLWEYLMTKTEIPPERKWGELGKKTCNRLVNNLTADTYQVNGKGRFRDEFVTCGGVSLSSVNHQTLESKVCPGLFFAGEILDIDAITGGFNFQAAWTTAYVVAQYIGKTNA